MKPATPATHPTTSFHSEYSPFVRYNVVMSFHGPITRLHNFVIKCKRCGEHIAAPVQTLPDTWIVAQCPLCSERRRYLPAEIFKGRLSFDFEEWARKARRGA